MSTWESQPVLDFIDSLDDAIVVLDGEGVIVAVNESWRRSSLENSPVPGKPVPGTGVGANYLASCKSGPGLSLNDDIVKASEGIRSVLEGRSPVFTLDYPCGSRWFNLSATPVDRGAVLRHTDITRVTRAERDLLERQKELQCLHDVSTLRNSPGISLPELMEGIVMLIPPAWQFPKIAAARIVLEEQTFQSKGFTETPWMLACPFEVNGKLAGRVEVCYLEECPPSDEGPFLIQERHLLNTLAERLGSIWKHHRTTEAWRVSEKRHQLLFERAVDGIFLLAPDGRLVAVNESFARMHGYSVAEIARLNLRDLDAPSSAKLARARIGRLLAGEALTFEVEHYHKDGHVFPLEVTGSLISVDGIPIIQCFHRDNTERKKAEMEKAELEAQNQQLRKAESLGRMAGAIAHHFNNQLQAVLLGLEMATKYLPPNAEPVACLELATQSARKAAEMSSLMLTYLGQTPGKREPLDLSEVCERSLPLLLASLPANVLLETDLCPPGLGLNADANQIFQVLVNLITNAWEASGDERSSIRLSVKPASAADIPASRCFPIDYQPQDKTYVCLAVADAGSGISAGDIERIFDPFFSTKFTGRGLGLAVVLGIARTHNGVVTVESEPGRGSSFRIFFPVAAKTVLPKPVQVPVAPISENIGRDATVLLIEDEPMLRETLRLALEVFDFTVLTAADGVEGLEILRKQRNTIDCVVCDLTMPRLNGWETLSALRQLKLEIPMILTSGYSEAKAMKGDHPEQPQAFLQKPFVLAKLIDTVSRLIAKRKD